MEAPRDMSTDVKAVAWAHVALGVFLGLVVVALGSVGSGGGAGSEGAAAAGSLLAVPLVLMAGLHVLGGLGFLQGRSWSRPALWFLSILQLVNFPVGTTIGAYTIWVLRNTS